MAALGPSFRHYETHKNKDRNTGWAGTYGQEYLTSPPYSDYHKDTEEKISLRKEVKVLLEEKESLSHKYMSEQKLRQEEQEKGTQLIEENIILREKIEKLEAEVNKIPSRFDILDL